LEREKNKFLLMKNKDFILNNDDKNIHHTIKFRKKKIDTFYFLNSKNEFPQKNSRV